MSSYKERIPTQREKILNLLREAGSKGVTNSYMSKIALNYKARIQELYEKGYVIEVESLKRGLFRYTLLEEPESVQEKPPRAIDVLKQNIHVKYGGAITSEQLESILDNMNFQVVRRSGFHKQKVEKQLSIF